MSLLSLGISIGLSFVNGIVENERDRKKRQALRQMHDDYYKQYDSALSNHLKNNEKAIYLKAKTNYYNEMAEDVSGAFFSVFFQYFLFFLAFCLVLYRINRKN
ncbi:hypothetical protein ACILDU_08425 [Capnocytophaga canimorsus]|uniref:hypothetical protein n=1 Tax=Capnocytophaga canimorsus TaxID=28188 RepID=UPI0037D7488C